MLITAALWRKQRKLVRAFERAEATSAAQARTPDELRLPLGMAWYRLVAHTVLRCPVEGRYFLDVASWQRLRRRRRALALAFIVGLLALLGLIWILSRHT